jgi:hypothetical protein
MVVGVEQPAEQGVVELVSISGSELRSELKDLRLNEDMSCAVLCHTALFAQKK